jgi:hypothetical protein
LLADARDLSCADRSSTMVSSPTLLWNVHDSETGIDEYGSVSAVRLLTKRPSQAVSVYPILQDLVC